MEKKIDRPIVKMARIKDNGAYDFHWYSTMMGKQSQIINIIKDTNNSLERIHELDTQHIKMLESIKDELNIKIEKLESKVFVFRPWNLFKKKKKDVGN